MNRKLTVTKDLLRWFLNFINMKIDDLPDDELLKLWIELRKIAYGEFGVFAVKDRYLVDWKGGRTRAKEIQQSLKDLLESILVTSKREKKRFVEPIYTEAELETAHRYEYGEIKDDTEGFQQVLQPIILSYTRNEPIPEEARDYIVQSCKLRVEILADGERVLTFFPDPRDKLLMEFVSLLAEFPLSSIRRCEKKDCGKYFLKATKREKRYCSSKCAWVMAQRKRREKETKEV